MLKRYYSRMNIQTLLPDCNFSNEKCSISILDEFFNRAKCQMPSVVELSFKQISLVYQAMEKLPAENTGHQTIVNTGKLTRELSSGWCGETHAFLHRAHHTSAA